MMKRVKIWNYRKKLTVQMNGLRTKEDTQSHSTAKVFEDSFEDIQRSEENQDRHLDKKQTCLFESIPTRYHKKKQLLVNILFLKNKTEIDRQEKIGKRGKTGTFNSTKPELRGRLRYKTSKRSQENKEQVLRKTEQLSSIPQKANKQTGIVNFTKRERKQKRRFHWRNRWTPENDCNTRKYPFKTVGGEYS